MSSQGLIELSTISNGCTRYPVQKAARFDELEIDHYQENTSQKKLSY